MAPEVMEQKDYDFKYIFLIFLVIYMRWVYIFAEILISQETITGQTFGLLA